ncbi:MAG: glycosyltransferase family 39 protein [Cyanobacteria bacterium P01_E01_bin.35]
MNQGFPKGYRFAYSRMYEEIYGYKFFAQDNLYFVGLLIAAVILYTSGLGDLPLRDWDEGIVAGVARNIRQASPGSFTWLFPTINYGEPYWNKPPLIHALIAISYRLFGFSEWSTRIVPALLSATSVPFLYLIGREIFIRRSAAIFSALVYLTLLPIARHGRVAMLDGAIACWFCLAIWCLLRGRQHASWLLGAGISMGLICLTKGMMMGVLLGSIILLFIFWAYPRLLHSHYIWWGLMLGITPAIAWYGLQYFRYGTQFLGISFGTQTFSRIWKPVSSGSSPPWYYLLEIIKYTLPWLIFLPSGVKLALKSRYANWSKLTLMWTGVYLLAISLMATKLPWYVIPIYPGLSLLIGVSLDQTWVRRQAPLPWTIACSLLAVICWGIVLYHKLVTTILEIELMPILVVMALGFTLTSILLWLNSRYFIPVIISGFYLTLLLLFNSSHWLWELNEAFAVKPVAEMLKQHTPPQVKIYTTYPHLRPSLEFYSDRVIVPATDQQILQYWQGEAPVYLLVDQEAINRLNLTSQQQLGSEANEQIWQLITQRKNLP